MSFPHRPSASAFGTSGKVGEATVKDLCGQIATAMVRFNEKPRVMDLGAIGLSGILMLSHVPASGETG
jgi:hypothetical protein